MGNLTKKCFMKWEAPIFGPHGPPGDHKKIVSDLPPSSLFFVSRRTFFFEIDLNPWYTWVLFYQICYPPSWVEQWGIHSLLQYMAAWQDKNYSGPTRMLRLPPPKVTRPATAISGDGSSHAPYVLLDNCICMYGLYPFFLKIMYLWTSNKCLKFLLNVII